MVIIVRNTARSILEKENRGPKTQSFTEDFAVSDMAEASDSYWENLSSGFDETSDEVLRKEIMRTVDSLPDWAADVLTLSAIYGCSTAEIAAIGGISTEAAKKRLQRARVLFQNKMKEGETK